MRYKCIFAIPYDLHIASNAAAYNSEEDNC
jgi:hypothetical protein